MPSRVIGSTRPAASPARHHPGPDVVSVPKAALRQRRDRPRVRLTGRAVREIHHANPLARLVAQDACGHAFVGLCADSDGEMRGAGKRPDVAGRIREQFEHDLVARRAVDEVTRGDGQIGAREGLGEPAAHEAVRAVGAKQPRRAKRPEGRADDERRAVRDVTSTARARTACTPAAVAAENSALSKSVRLATTRSPRSSGTDTDAWRRVSTKRAVLM